MTPTTNGLPQLLPNFGALSRADKLRIIQFLAADLVRDEGEPLLEPGASYPVWTPLEAYDAAAVLLRELERAAP